MAIVTSYSVHLQSHKHKGANRCHIKKLQLRVKIGSQLVPSRGQPRDKRHTVRGAIHLLRLFQDSSCPQSSAWHALRAVNFLHEGKSAPPSTNLCSATRLARAHQKGKYVCHSCMVTGRPQRALMTSDHRNKPHRDQTLHSLRHFTQHTIAR